MAFCNGLIHKEAGTELKTENIKFDSRIPCTPQRGKLKDNIPEKICPSHPGFNSLVGALIRQQRARLEDMLYPNHVTPALFVGLCGEECVSQSPLVFTNIASPC